MNYDQVLKHIQTLAEIPLNQEDENFARITPLMFTYAENRIYRELDFLATTTVTQGVLTADSVDVELPSTILVLRQMAVFTPVGYTWQNKFTRNVLERVSPEALDMFWPQLQLPLPGIPRVPRQYAILGKPTAGPPQVLSYTVRLAPIPDHDYGVEFMGMIRPEPLSPKNTETYLSIYFPDLLCAACMVFVAGYQRDYGSQADDPQKAQSWNAQYETLKMGATLESARLKGEGAGWTSMPPAPVAMAPRGG